ncbi:hypothetical protein HETIRDRAFT_117945 [Heterobasidion irregulare TC 32-1]|uniref:Uncharacterized protein n=1 Tax=Heterobasidion irregulare (strain TC 32-1) TaxID=747525 RepID=W4K6F9_HETIT|nr:uncharacterized protein HETIRDRAFT_117945 [Heterobasidion irregulare TC 32-1]ETW81388.1 hypothetical protein HETIRDRAFT_117945 [Heterobasidion irregulare TC 32-1]
MATVRISFRRSLNDSAWYDGVMEEEEHPSYPDARDRRARDQRADFKASAVLHSVVFSSNIEQRNRRDEVWRPTGLESKNLRVAATSHRDESQQLPRSCRCSLVQNQLSWLQGVLTILFGVSVYVILFRRARTRTTYALLAVNIILYAMSVIHWIVNSVVILVVVSAGRAEDAIITWFPTINLKFVDNVGDSVASMVRRHRRFIKSQLGAGTARKNAEKILGLLIESGTIYFCIWSLYVVIYYSFQTSTFIPDTIVDQLVMQANTYNIPGSRQESIEAAEDIEGDGAALRQLPSVYQTVLFDSSQHGAISCLRYYCQWTGRERFRADDHHLKAIMDTMNTTIAIGSRCRYRVCTGLHLSDLCKFFTDPKNRASHVESHVGQMAGNGPSDEDELLSYTEACDWSNSDHGLRFRRPQTKATYALLAVNIILYAMSVIHWIVNSVVILGVISVGRAEDVIIEWFPTINHILCEAIVVWRAWLIWECNAKICIPSFICLFGTLASVVVGIVLEFSGYISLDLALGPLMWGFLLGSNLWSTSIIAWRAWRHRQFIKSQLGAGTTRTNVEKILGLLIESGTIYFCIWVWIYYGRQIALYIPQSMIIQLVLEDSLELRKHHRCLEDLLTEYQQTRCGKTWWPTGLESKFLHVALSLQLAITDTPWLLLILKSSCLPRFDFNSTGSKVHSISSLVSLSMWFLNLVITLGIVLMGMGEELIIVWSPTINNFPLTKADLYTIASVMFSVVLEIQGTISLALVSLLWGLF